MRVQPGSSLRVTFARKMEDSSTKELIFHVEVLFMSDIGLLEQLLVC